MKGCVLMLLAFFIIFLFMILKQTENYDNEETVKNNDINVKSVDEIDIKVPGNTNREDCIDPVANDRKVYSQYPIVNYVNLPRERRMFDTLTYDLQPYTTCNSRIN